MSKVPKALIHLKYTLAVSPSENQLLDFFKEYGLKNLNEIVDDFGSWEEVMREWLINTYFTAESINLCITKNIYQFESIEESETIEIIDDLRWDELKNEDLIY